MKANPLMFFSRDNRIPNHRQTLKVLNQLEWQCWDTFNAWQSVCHYWCFLGGVFGSMYVGWINRYQLLKVDKQDMTRSHLLPCHLETCRWLCQDQYFVLVTSLTEYWPNLCCKMSDPMMHRYPKLEVYSQAISWIVLKPASKDIHYFGIDWT